MQTDVYRLWPSRIVTFAVAALAAASAAYWGLKTWGPPAPAPAAPLAATWASPVSPKALALALGGGLAAPMAAAEPEPAAASRYTLVGVVAVRSRGGAALISMDGQAAKPVRVGALVEGGMVLESVTGRRAVLAAGRDAGAARVTLELPLRDN